MEEIEKLQNNEQQLKAYLYDIKSNIEALTLEGQKATQQLMNLKKEIAEISQKKVTNKPVKVKK